MRVGPPEGGDNAGPRRPLGNHPQSRPTCFNVTRNTRVPIGFTLASLLNEAHFLSQ